MKNNIKVRSVCSSNVEVIKQRAFWGCSALKEASFTKLRRIYDGGFENCSNLREFILISDLQEIGNASFQKCKKLRRVIFQNNIYCKNIPNRAFAECRDLEEIRFPERVENIEAYAFYKCDHLKNIELPETVKNIGEKAFYQCAFESIILPSRLECIGDSAFLKCKQLQYIKIPENVKRIGKWAFHGCGNLKVLELTHDPQYIGEWITNKNCTIRCKKGSKIEKYAQFYGVNIELM